MGTKYSHDEGVREAREARRTPYRRMARPGRVSRGVRGTLWVVGLSLVAVLAVFMTTLYQRPGPGRFTPRQGEAVVVEKSVSASGAYQLRLRIVPDGVGRDDTVHTVDKSVWDRLAAGDRVAVLYRLDRRAKRVVVVETGRFALPGDLQ